MHSVNKALRHAVLLVLLALDAGPALAIAQDASTPSRTEVQSAAEQVKKDPNLGGTRKSQTLRLKDMADFKPKDAKHAPPPAWLAGLARWISEAGRLVVWALGALALALLLVGLRHWVKVRADVVAAKSIKLPSHVRQLDIRPESLPALIGDAARELWQRGEHHAALSLLYRGALSRLVHDHGVPILAASTEGECVQLARRLLDPAQSDYLGQLVNAWQLTVYGARLPDDAAVLSLCSDFDARLGASNATPEVRP